MVRFDLDPNINVRRVSLRDLVKLVRLLVDCSPARYQELANLAREQGTLLTHKGKTVGKTTFYHYVTAMKTLGLAWQDNNVYRPTGLAEKLSKLVPQAEAPLSPPAKTVLREAITSSDILWRNFLVLFTCEPSRSLTPSHPIAYLPTKKRQYVLRPFCNREDIELSESQTDAIIWGIRLWCLEAALIDEILIPRIAEIPPEEINILYLITKTKDDIAHGHFAELVRQCLLELLSNRGEYSHLVSIPLLLYHLCPYSGLSLSDAKDYLGDWISRNAGLVRAERGALGILEAGDSRGTLATREKMLRSFLIIDGSYLTHITVTVDAVVAAI
jgi:hypothetical protein